MNFANTVLFTLRSSIDCFSLLALSVVRLPMSLFKARVYAKNTKDVFEEVAGVSSEIFSDIKESYPYALCCQGCVMVKEGVESAFNSVF